MTDTQDPTQANPADTLADLETGPDPSQVIALSDLRGLLVAIGKIDPSNTGTGRDDQYRYAVRNALVVDALAAAMRAGLPAGVRPMGTSAPDPYGWPIVFIDLPTGEQLSWHMPPYHRPYDGHTTAEKYARIRAWSASFTPYPAVPDAD